MKQTLKTLLLLAASLAPLPALANEKSEVEAAFASWRNALSSGKAENVVKLYAADAILLATLADKPITTQQARTEYFTGLVAKTNMKVTVDEEHIRLLDEDDAVISGLYSFSFDDNGKKVTIPARYSFVMDKKDGAWQIVEHHSSRLPSAK